MIAAHDALPTGDFTAQPVVPEGPDPQESAPVTVRPATPDDASEIAAVIRAAFGARERIGPPPQGLTETAESVTAKLALGGGFVAEADRIVAVVLVHRASKTARLGRVCVLPAYQHQGIAAGMVREVSYQLAADGVLRIQARVRPEYPGLLRWWLANDFARIGEEDGCILVDRFAPYFFVAENADQMRTLGERLSLKLRPGDLVIASGDLGAGKTTLAQGVGAGLHVDRPIISPTFVLSRIHPSLVGGPPLVHVDAYRLDSWDELVDLDLDETAGDSVTFVEWGTGIAEGLSSDRLEIDIRRDDPTSDHRSVFITGVGPRWDGVVL